MAKMRIAARAFHFGADHAVAGITDFGHRAFADRRVEARPAATGIELGRGIEQWFIAADAVVDTVGFGVVVFAGERALGGTFTDVFLVVLV
jgi:hypothetical protein